MLGFDQISLLWTILCTGLKHTFVVSLEIIDYLNNIKNIPCYKAMNFDIFTYINSSLLFLDFLTKNARKHLVNLGNVNSLILLSLIAPFRLWRQIQISVSRSAKIHYKGMDDSLLKRKQWS